MWISTLSRSRFLSSHRGFIILTTMTHAISRRRAVIKVQKSSQKKSGSSPMVAWGLAMIWACLGSMALSFLVFWGAFWNLGGVSSHPDVGHVWFWAIGPTALTASFGSLRAPWSCGATRKRALWSSQCLRGSRSPTSGPTQRRFFSPCPAESTWAAAPGSKMKTTGPGAGRGSSGPAFCPS